MTLPSGWASVKLGEVADLQLGKMLDKAKNAGAPAPYLRNVNVRWFDFDLRDVYEMPFQPVEFEKFSVRDGDVLICEGGEPGRAAVWQGGDSDLKFQKALHRARLTEGIRPEWLAAHLRNDALNGVLEAYFVGTTIKHLTGVALSRYTLDVPPTAEQDRILKVVSRARLIASDARKLLEHARRTCEKLRQSILAAAFRGDLTAEWRGKNPDVEPASVLLERIRKERRQKWEEAELAKLQAKGKTPTDDRWKQKYVEPEPVDTTELPELPDGWCCASWQEVGFSQNGRAFPSDQYTHDGAKLLRPGNLYSDGTVQWTGDNTRRLPDRYAVEFDDYVVGGRELVMNLTAQSLKDQFLGRVCLTSDDESCLLNQRLARLQPIRLQPEFVLWLLKAPPFRAYVDGLNTGSLIQHMFTSQLDRFVFALPPAAEQLAILDSVSKAMAAADAVEARTNEAALQLRSLEEAILAKAFRGELVPQDPNDEPASVLLERIRALRAAHETTPKASRRVPGRSRAAEPRAKTKQA